MDRIYFRAKYQNGYKPGWMYGYILRVKDGYGIVPWPVDVVNEDSVCDIMTLHVCPVDPKTIGEHVGITDKYGNAAFEGDIFEDSDGVLRLIQHQYGGFVFESNPLHFGYNINGNYSPSENLAEKQNADWFCTTCKIVGNIHDNPELLSR